MRPNPLMLWLLKRTLPARDREEALDDIREEHARLAHDDAAAARRWVRRQAVWSVASMPQRLLPASPQPQFLVSEGRHLMRGFMRDLGFGLRLLRHQPLTASAGILSLAIGLGLNVLLFTLMNAILLKPLPIAGADRLVMVQMQHQDDVAMDFSYPFYEHLRAASVDVFDTLVAYSSARATARVGGRSESVTGEYVSGNFFTDLAVPMAMGRGLTPADDRPDAPPALVISQGLYRRLFGDAPLTGQTITMNRTPFTIVGVADRRFFGTEIGETADFWVAIGQMHTFEQEDYRSRPTVSWLALMGRLTPGVAREAARARLAPAATSFFETLKFPPRTLLLAEGAQGDSDLPRNVGGELRLLTAASLFVLLIACVNVANLQLARVSARRHELAVRAALGAGRARLAGLLVADAVVLTVPAGLIALAAAALWKDQAARLIAIWGEPVVLALPIDAAVAGAALALTVASCGAIGGLSALLSLRRSPSLTLAEGGRARIGAASRSQRVLVIVQFAASMMLVAGAALLVRTVDHLRGADMGFIRNVALLHVALGPAGYTRDTLPRYYERAFDAVRRVPGVEDAAIAHVMPLDFGGSRQTIEIDGYDPADGEDMEINTVRVSPGYFSVMRMPVIAGREFNAVDTRDQPQRVIVNETMARKYWSNGRAVGRFARFFARSGGPRPFDVEIIGVVADARYRMVREPPRPTFYISTSQQPISFFVLHVRTSGPPDARLGEIERTIAGLDPDVPVTRAVSLEQQLDRNIADERMARSIALALGGAALVLAALGLYATMAFAVRQRTHEIGVRMALGADEANVRMMVVSQGFVLVTIGLVAGTMGAVWTGRALESQLFGVSPMDPFSLLASGAVLTAAGLAASWLPARRATRIQPVTALRVS